MTLLNMSVMGAVLIFVILALRAAALHRLPKPAFVALWQLALARLLIPFRIPSALSVYALWNRVKPAGALPEAAFTDAPQIAMPAPPPAARLLPAAQGAGRLSPWLMIWFIGAAICLAAVVGLYLRWRGIFRVSLPVEDESVAQWLRAHPLRRKIAVRQSDRLRAPLTYGLIRPVILLPKSMLPCDERALSHVLTHEYVHIRRLDALTKLLVALAVCVYWFNPAVWLMALYCNRDIELACDARVLSLSGEASGADYALTLIGLAEEQRLPLPFASGLGGNSIEERIRFIMKPNKKSLAATVAAILLVMGVAAAFATSAPNGNLSQDVTIHSAVSDETRSRQSILADRADFSKSPELFHAYERHGVSYNAAGHIYYNGQPVRYLWDGFDVTEGSDVIGQSILYEYLNREGTVDVRVVRDAENDMARVVAIEPYSQAEYDALDVDALVSGYAQTSVAVHASDDLIPVDGAESTAELMSHDEVSVSVRVADSVESGVTFAEYFSRFAPYGVRYQETQSDDGILQRLYWNDRPVDKFVDIGPDSTTTFNFNTDDSTGVAVQALYADEKLIGVGLWDKE